MCDPAFFVPPATQDEGEGLDAEHEYVLDPHCFDHLLPCTVPVTLEFNPPIVGEATVSGEGDGLMVHMKLRAEVVAEPGGPAPWKGGMSFSLSDFSGDDVAKRDSK